MSIESDMLDETDFSEIIQSFAAAKTERGFQMTVRYTLLLSGVARILSWRGHNPPLPSIYSLPSPYPSSPPFPGAPSPFNGGPGV